MNNAWKIKLTNVVYTEISRLQGLFLRPLDRVLAPYVLKKNRVDRLQLGCGGEIVDGWINTDWHNSTWNFVNQQFVDLITDHRRGIPFPDQSFQYINCAHTLEHFRPHTAKYILKECHRTLKPGGVTRIVVPDVRLYIEAYLDNKGAVRKVHGDNPHWPKWTHTDLEDLLTIIHGAPELGWVHCWGYDYNTLSCYLSEAGFSEIWQRPNGEALPGDPEFPAFEVFRKQVLSLYVDARKQR